MSTVKVNQYVEALCHGGCAAVNATIEAAEKGLPVAQMEGLSEHEKQLVLDELKAIMAVYETDSTEQPRKTAEKI